MTDWEEKKNKINKQKQYKERDCSECKKTYKREELDFGYLAIWCPKHHAVWW